MPAVFEIIAIVQIKYSFPEEQMTIVKSIQAFCIFLAISRVIHVANDFLTVSRQFRFDLELRNFEFRKPYISMTGTFQSVTKMKISTILELE